MKVFESDNNNEIGLSVSSVVKTLARNFSENEVRQSINFLTNEGHLFSTTDEEHFKCTSM